KEELFLVMLDERFAKELERIDRTLSGTDDPETEARLAAAEFIHFASDDDWPRLYFQFAAHAARNEEFRQELATRQQAMRERLVEVYERWTKQFEIDPPLPIADIAAMTYFMADGFLVDRLIEPGLDEARAGLPRWRRAGSPPLSSQRLREVLDEPGRVPVRPRLVG
ncbi:MAG: hypothetical protein E6G49_12035, partial [Actinobacteria bacterium]